LICSAVADATEYSLAIDYRGLKATAKLMPTLRVEPLKTAGAPPAFDVELGGAEDVMIGGTVPIVRDRGGLHVS